ncbi:MAG TPA: YdeI/OmpD-associated family protein [Polyangia bacterium]|nr:YdeI/OmpD-associated family protein [Polyangia bacterium]
MAAKKVAAELETIAPASAKAWEAWLAKNHGRVAGVWLRMPKGQGQTLTWATAVEGALIWGWIDGQRRPLDETAWLQRYTPRGPRSAWSKLNRTRVEALVASGRMRAPGLAEVERAKADGRWERAYDSPKTAAVPDDLARALKKNAKAAAFFAALDGANRYAILYRVQHAKRAETRARRIETFVAMCARGETIHPKRPSKPTKR